MRGRGCFRRYRAGVETPASPDLFSTQIAHIFDRLLMHFASILNAEF
jgi:hypothetical protein